MEGADLHAELLEGAGLQPELERACEAELQEGAAGAVGAVVIDASDDESTDLDESEATTVE